MGAVQRAASGRTPPTAKGLPLVGLVPELIVRGFIPMLRDHWRAHGDFWRMELGGQSVLVFVHPDGMKRVLKDNRDNYVKGPSYDDFRLIVGEGLLTLEGAAWSNRRRFAAPAFHRSSVRELAPLFVQRAEAMIDAWRTRPDPSAPVDVFVEMTHLTMDIAGRAFFDRTVGDQDASARSLAEALEVSSERGNTALAAPLSWPTPSNRRLKRALRDLDRMMYEVVDDQRGKKKSLLARMANAVDPETGRMLERRALRDEAVTLFVAGHETTALTLTWAYDLLSRHPDVVENIANEVKRVVGDASPTYEQLERLEYTRAVVDEVLRLRPPAWSFGRDTVADDVISGFDVPAGTTIMPLPFFTHRHPAFWDAPSSFRPERFLGEAAKRQHPFAYVPFSAGPRACIGMHFSIIEALAVLTVLVQNVRLTRATPEMIELDAQITLRPKGKVPAHVRFLPR